MGLHSGGRQGGFGGSRGRGRGGRQGGFGGNRFGNKTHSRGGFGRPREMHKAVCDECKQPCEVPFKPTKGKPVYCKECYSKRSR